MNVGMRLRSIAPPSILSREYRKPGLNRGLCIFDCETDPFGHNLEIAPFTCDFFDGETHTEFWGDDCIKQFADYMETRREDELLIYAHNLGGFDIHFLYDYFDHGCEPLIIGGRVAEASLFGQTWRDSYRIYPEALSGYKKDPFDYEKMLRSNREAHKVEILLYQQHDCEYLFELVSGFQGYFGNRITIGNAAINLLESYQGFQRMTERQDARVRPYFFGGRCQAFERGIIRDDWKIFDVNSMYPFVMANFQHPISAMVYTGRHLTEKTAFATIRARNRGALPMRAEDGSLDFSCPRGEFFASIHEIKAAEDLGLIDIERVIETLDFETWATFEEYVREIFAKKVAAEAAGDLVMKKYHKRTLNASYGKFAQDPRRYKDYRFSRGYEVPPDGLFDPETNPAGWRAKYQSGDFYVWERKDPAKRLNFLNVATGASITGASRAVLMRGLAMAERPVYCDTDSIICRDFAGPIHPTNLGAWNMEATGDLLAIAGKKTYALLEGDREIKKASKGVGLSAAQIVAVAGGEVIRYRMTNPTFTLGGGFEYIEREIRATG